MSAGSGSLRPGLARTGAAFAILAALLAACSSAPPASPGGGAATRTTGAPSAAGPTSSGTASAAEPSRAAATPTPAPLPPYAIDALRDRPVASGSVRLGQVLDHGPGYTKYAVTWTSMGSTMTGVLDLPDGSGPFPVAIVNHGYAPVSAYYQGEDSAKYADPLSANGFITVSPNYPGYVGSGPGEADVPALVAEAISDMDLISQLSGLAQADLTRVSAVGHSNGGGVAEILLTADPRIHSAVLYAPVSSDMADNARKWWTRTPGGTGPLGSPDADPTAYQLMSPRYHLPAVIPPTLIMQGTQDEDIPADWTAATVQALQAAHARVQFVSFPGATHIFAGADLDRANALALDWLRS